ncbi:uncharacterized protein LOC126908031 isoform X2 [Daktulosphaira vitifoliae]|uniref:uncharacterized protein LOC126908031 isoform X2 n=1 Tax=Daktulosphaira vitifoliae TaxID=58002 RepID=UPI0021AAD063|nr:uncharacterized protein LOC126908031 isoform X2 [Daktulosphaira vitifoliae]
MTAKEIEVSEEYSNALADLNINSKPLINMLTMLAEENSAYAPIIVQCIERQLHKVQAESKLPVLYLIDSIIKNIGQPYIQLFVQNIEHLFASTFLKVDEKTRTNMFKLRSTWNEVIPASKLHSVDVAVNALDKNWPVSAAPVNIHVNPKFLNTVNPSEKSASIQPVVSSAVKDQSVLQKQLLKKHQELLQLQQKKLELELLHTKSELEKQQKQIDKLNIAPKDVPNVFPNMPLSSSTKINPVSTQLLQTVRHRDPRLRKTENSAKITSNNNDKLPLSKKKEEKKFDKLKRESNKHHDLRKKERSRSPVKKEAGNKLNKKSDYKEKSPKDDKYHKRKDEKKTKDLDSKKKGTIAIINSQVNKPVLNVLSSPQKDITVNDANSNLFEDSKKDISEPFYTSVAKECVTESTIISALKVDNLDVDIIKSVPAICDLSKKDSNIEDSDSLKRLHMYMQTMKKSPEPSTSVITSTEMNDKIIPVLNSNKNVLITPQNDIDLRVIAPTNKRTTSDAIKVDDNEPMAKKSKSEIIDELFGAEDVDLRTLTTPTIVPSPPYITETIKQESGKSWAKYKEIKPDTFKTPYKSPTKKMPGVVSEHLIETQDVLDVDMRSKTVQSNSSLILKQAEEALNAGNISFDEYNKIMCQVLKMTEVEKLEEAKKNDDKNLKLKKYVIPKISQSCGENGLSIQTKLEAGNDTIPVSNLDLQSKASVQPPTSDELISCNQVTEDQSKSIENNKISYLGNEKDNKPMDIDERVNLKPLVGEIFPSTGPWNILNKKHSDGSVSGSESDSSSKSTSSESEESKKNPRKLDSDDRSTFKKRKNFRRNEKDITKGSRNWKNNKNWNTRPDNGLRFTQNRVEPWSRGPRPNYSHSSRSLVPPPMYEVPRPTAPFASSTPDWTVPVIPPSDPVILDMIANDPTQTINIDGVSREIRFYGPTAITFVSWDDPREIYFQGPPRNVIFDDLFSVLCHFNAPDREFLLDGQPHRVRLGAPTREIYLDGNFYECFFGGPPIYTELGAVKRSIKLEGPPPSVNIGTTKRVDLVAGRIAIIIDNNFTVPVYLDAKPQRIDVGNTALILRFIDGLMRALINDQPFKVNYNGPPQAIIVRGKKHYLRFTGLPSNIRPGYAAISQMMGVVLTEDTAAETLPPLPAPPIPSKFTGFDMPLTSVEDISQPPQSFTSSTYSLIPPSSLPAVNLVPSVLPQLEVVSSSFATPAVPTAPVLPSNMDINELFKKLVDSGIVPKDKPQEIIQSKIVRKEKNEENLAVKPVDFSDPSTLKQKQPGLIHNLYTGIQCSSCGIRFTAEYTVKYSSHLDWHFRQNRREKMASKTVQSRKWYYDTSDWCKYEEQEDESTRAASWFELQSEEGVKEEEQQEEENVPCFPAGENSELAACYLCHDQFEQFYSEKDEEWQLRNCIEKDKRLYHPMCYDDMIKTREEKIRKRNEAIEEAKQLEIKKIELQKEQQLEGEILKKIKEETLKNIKEEEIKVKSEQNIKEEILENIKKDEISIKVNSEILHSDENNADIKINKNVFDDVEIPETMEIIHSATEVLSPKVKDEPIENNNTPLLTESEVFTEEPIKSKSPSPVSTMTCSIDGNTDTEWNVPVAPAMGTIKININQKATAIIKPLKPTVEVLSTIVEPKSPQDFTPTFGEIDPDQPPPPGLEMETVVIPLKPKRELKPRLLNNVKKLKEYPAVNKGKEMSGLCSIM